MTKSKIPISIQELLDEFIRYNFYKIEYKRLAGALKKNVDTIIQRVKRNNEYFDIDDSQRPAIISVKKGVPEIYFYRDKNTCQICQKQVIPNELVLRFRNPSKRDKYDWSNVLSVCNECKDKPIVKIKKQIKSPLRIEYKEINITWDSELDEETGQWNSFLKFDELDGSGYFPLLDSNEKIASKTIADVLNYFAADDWEVMGRSYAGFKYRHYLVLYDMRRSTGEGYGEQNSCQQC